jgi:hypothetical protein
MLYVRLADNLRSTVNAIDMAKSELTQKKDDLMLERSLMSYEERMNTIRNSGK